MCPSEEPRFLHSLNLPLLKANSPSSKGKIENKVLETYAKEKPNYEIYIHNRISVNEMKIQYNNTKCSLKMPTQYGI